jgi:hypothetical protein
MDAVRVCFSQRREGAKRRKEENGFGFGAMACRRLILAFFAFFFAP